MPAEQDFLRAVGLHQAGQLDLAEAIYRTVEPSHAAYPDARHYLGLIAFQRGDFARAAEAISEAIGLCLRNRRAVPAEFYVNLGNACKRNGRQGDALDAYRNALSLRPEMFPAWYNLGLVQRELGDLDGAADSFSRACRLQPDDARAWVELGECYARVGADSDAVRCFEAALPALTSPGSGEATKPLRVRVGRTLVELGRFEQAIGILKPLRLANAGDVDFLNALGCALLGVGHLGEAEKIFLHARSLDRNGIAVRDNLAATLKDGGQVDRALQVYRSLLDVPGAGIGTGTWSNYLMTMLYSGIEDPAFVLAEHRRASPAFLPTAPATAATAATAAAAAAAASVASACPTGRVLRIGYLSGDLRNHPVAYFLAAFMGAHDPKRVTVCVYDNSPLSDRWTARLKSIAPHWRHVRSISDVELADAIRADRIDVLIDLSGHTADNRLSALALRPAPVQVSFLGYAFSTGLPWIDWRFVDWVTDPQGAEALSSERLYRLPRSYYAYAPPVDAPEVSLSPVGRNGRLTFGVSSNLAKVTPLTLDHWATVLDCFPDSRLIWKAKPFADATVRKRMLAELADRKVGKGRVRLESWSGHDDRWAFFHAVDVALDTYPYNQATNTCEALWMGVPTISACGSTHPSRMGASILAAGGLQSWVVPAEEFRRGSDALRARLSRLLAAGPLATLRATLRDQLLRSELFDTRSLARAIEDACCQIVEATGTGRRERADD